MTQQPLQVRVPRRGCTAFPVRSERDRPTAATDPMPFFDHRTIAEVWEEEARHAILKRLGR
jgi:hypothetical protein